MKRENEMNCQQARPFYYDYLTRQRGQESEGQFKHIEECSNCRQQIEILRNELEKTGNSVQNLPDIFALHHNCLGEWVDCDIVKPFLISIAHPGLCVQAQTPVTEHIRNCRACRNDLQAILSLKLSGHQFVQAAQILSGEPVSRQVLSRQELAVIEAIRDRKSSGIVTQLSVDNDANARLQVRPAVPSHTRRHFLTRFAAAAGILLVASLVILMTTTAGGVSIHDVYGAIHALENCKIEIRDAEMDAPGQKILISRKFNLVLSQRKEETVLLDFVNQRILKSTPQDGVVIKSSELKISSQVYRPDFGLLPFDSVAYIPAGYQWQRQDLLSQGGDYEVYDLTWTENLMPGQGIEKKWRGYLLRYSHLPVRIEWFEKFPGQAEEKITETTISYPDSRAIQDELKHIPLYRLLNGDQAE